jgi:mono/diheme cytochrome c family protein
MLSAIAAFRAPPLSTHPRRQYFSGKSVAAISWFYYTGRRKKYKLGLEKIRAARGWSAFARSSKVFRGKMMARPAAVLCALLCCVFIGCSGKSAPQTNIPQEEIDRKNPVESKAASIEEGKRLYGATDCTLCHGKDGDGKGLQAKDTNMNVHDWRKSQNLEHFTDGQLSYLILKGKGRMPAYDGRETPEQVWQIVNYIRSLPANGNAPKS